MFWTSLSMNIGLVFILYQLKFEPKQVNTKNPIALKHNINDCLTKTQQMAKTTWFLQSTTVWNDKNDFTPRKKK